MVSFYAKALRCKGIFASEKWEKKVALYGEMCNVAPLNFHHDNSEVIALFLTGSIGLNIVQ